MNIPDSIARHVRSRTVIADVSANAETARRRMSAANGQLTKARKYLAKEDWEASAIFAESTLMVAFEAYLMGVKLKLGTTAGSHQAMADITAYLARRAGVAVEPYQLHDVVDARSAILYHPWDLVAQRELAESAVDVAAKAVAVLMSYPPLAPPAEPSDESPASRSHRAERRDPPGTALT